ncbi:LytTR family DNA-binding domain-containing protein [Isoptericola sp. BMS4]|uniref:LytR/AlgR family response regulator transcription factor n=1 Tax=Isoptericola sp. BMS4 TaxID=2527875 RepID=UPI0014229F8B|nr:LytTR family DNA-binding domain-containing protein [Isoptericola sp. BMS4]
MRPRALIVDDEAPARAELRYLLAEVGGVQVVGEATNGEEALLLLESLDYDLVLLDVRMPGGSGLDVARALARLPRRPQVVFTTAYPDHAVEAFDLAAADYLVKPFDADRLRRALDRALAHVGADPEAPPVAPAAGARAETAAAPPAAPDPLVRVPVQRDGRTVLVDGDAIVYASATRGYSSLKLADERLLVSYSLNELERRLRGHFFRAHRAYLVNLDHVRELVPDFRGTLALVMDDRQRSRVEVSRRHARELRRRLGL